MFESLRYSSISGNKFDCLRWKHDWKHSSVVVVQILGNFLLVKIRFGK